MDTPRPSRQQRFNKMSMESPQPETQGSTFDWRDILRIFNSACLACTALLIIVVIVLIIAWHA